jgi:hypothetical protein
VGTISDELQERGPLSFTLRRLQKQGHPFAHRSALFYTPTGNIPPQHVGSGALDVTLPVATPDYTDLCEIRALGSPRLWIDLIQRHTGKLRWLPMLPARIVFRRYDYFSIRTDHLAIGMKGLLDALKVRTTGRRDRIHLHYFGAIVDDGPGFIEVTYEQELVPDPKEAGVRIQVLPSTPNTTGQRTRGRRSAPARRPPVTIK